MQSSTRQAIDGWVREAMEAAANDRSENRRHPFFRSVTVHHGAGPKRKLPAFSRDISSLGIGLFHNFPLAPGRISVTVPRAKDRSNDMLVEITWCEPCGGGWFQSGGRFLELSTRQVMSLLLTTALADLHRRVKDRFPFFRPITVNLAGGQPFGVMSRDISAAGMGFLHQMPLPSGTATLTVPRAAEGPFDIRTSISWCAPCGEGWYISGGPFKLLTLEELPHRLL